MDTKVLLGSLGVLLGFISYIPYIRNTLNGSIKPHAFSWLVWWLMAVIGFAAQVSDGAGAGAWVIGLAVLCDGIVLVFALKKGERHFALLDYVSLAGAGLALVAWGATGGPLLSVFIVALIDTFGFIPTFRKTYQKPFEENISLYALSAAKYTFAVAAIEHYSLITSLYPAWLIFMNCLFVAMTVARRQTKKAVETI